MRISKVQTNADFSAQNQARLNGVLNTKAVTSPIKSSRVSSPHSMISFGGAKNKGHVLHVLAELPPWMKVGGVATVGKDYMNMAKWLDELKAQNPDIAAALGDGKSKVSLIFPYYNGVIGKDNSVSVRTDAAGKPIWVNDVNSKKFAYDPAGLASEKNAITHLTEVVSSDMQWGLTEKSPVRLFKVASDHPALKDKSNVDVYMLFTEEVARMPKAYANGDYCSEPKKVEIAKKIASGDDFSEVFSDAAKREDAEIKAFTSNQPYHQFSKGVVDAVKKAGIDAETIICSDSQTMLIPDFIAQQAEMGDDFYAGAKTTGVFHNTGAVYCGECSAKDLFLAEATPEQIQKVRRSPEYIFAKEIGREEDYFKRFVKGYIDDAGNINPNMGMLRHVQNGNAYVNTVSGVYAKSMAMNPDVTPLNSLWKELYEQGKVSGIINGFEDASVSAFEKLGLSGYTKRIFSDPDSSGKSVSLQPYVTYKIDDMKAAINPQTTTLKVAKDSVPETIVADVAKLFEEGRLERAIFRFNDDKGVKKLKDFSSKDGLSKLDGKEILSVILENKPLAETNTVERSIFATPEMIKEEVAQLFKEGGLNNATFQLEDGTRKISHDSQGKLSEINGKKILGLQLEDRPLLQVSASERALIENATNPTLETAKIAKRHNKESFLRRFTEEFSDLFGEKEVQFAETGLPGRNCSIMGSIDKKYLTDIHQGKDVPLFVSWGRGDFQKGHPIALESFMKFAKTDEGKNSLLVMGGELPKETNEAKKILNLMAKVGSDPDLKGRIVFIDGFAPGYAMSSAADYAVFASRFEPCGLTPAEAQKYFCTPIVLNTQGLSQQIFDPRNASAETINGYKTVNEFYMPKEKIDNIIKLFTPENVVLDDTVKAQLHSDFPEISKTDDFALFREFGKKYNALFEKAKNNIFGLVPEEKLAEQAKIELENMSEYADLISTLKENVLQDELVAAMKQGVNDSATPAVAERIFANHLNLKTGWMENANLNGVDPQTGKVISSAELYCRRHVMLDASKNPLKRVFEFRDDLVDKNLGDLHPLNTDTAKENTATIAAKAKEFVSGNKKAVMITGAIAAMAAVAAGVIYSNNKKTKVASNTQKVNNQAPVEQTPAPAAPAPPAPIAPVVQVNQAQAVAPLATTQAAVANQKPAINLAGNKFAACFDKIA